MTKTAEDHFKPKKIDEDRNDYRASFRMYVFRLLALGYEKLNIPDYETEEEEAITGDLVKEIKKNQENPRLAKWAHFLFVTDEKPINSPGRKGKNRKRVDIQFELGRPGKRPHFSFEAKRLSAGSHPIGAYLEPSGLGEFLSGEYGRDDPEGGMLGYVQSHTPEH